MDAVEHFDHRGMPFKSRWISVGIIATGRLLRELEIPYHFICQAMRMGARAKATAAQLLRFNSRFVAITGRYLGVLKNATPPMSFTALFYP